MQQDSQLKSLPDPSVREAHQRGTTPVSHSAVHHAGIAKRKAPVLTDKGVIRGTTLHYTSGLSLTRTNASLTDFNEVLSGDTLLFHTGSHLVRLSVISKSSLLLILACLYEDNYRAEGWTLSRGHRKDLSSPSSGVNSHAFLPSIVSVCCARSPHSSTHRYRPR